MKPTKISGHLRRKWEIWEGGGMDVVFRLIDPEEELADFLFQCDEFFDEWVENKILIIRTGGNNETDFLERTVV